MGFCVGVSFGLDFIFWVGFRIGFFTFLDSGSFRFVLGFLCSLGSVHSVHSVDSVQFVRFTRFSLTYS